MNRRSFFGGLAAFFGLGAVAKSEPAKVKELAREFVQNAKPGQVVCLQPGTVVKVPVTWQIEGNTVSGGAFYCGVVNCGR